MKQSEEKTTLGGPGACSPGKIFEILYGVMAFLEHFEQILIKLFVPHSESFTKYDAFCSHIFDLQYACLLQARSGYRKMRWGEAILNYVKCLLL